jgi:hypothetical protein
MSRRYLNTLAKNGDAIATADLTLLGLPTIPAAVASYVSAKHVVGPVNKTILTLTALPVLVVDEAGVTAYAGSQLLDFPAGAIAIDAALINLTTVAKTAAANIIADAFDGDVALGTVTATNTALASKTVGLAEQAVIPYTTMAQAASGSTTAKAQSRRAITAITDSTGGTASDTIANTAGATPDTAEFENAIATLSAKINALIANGGGAKLLLADGTTTAVDLFLNFLIDDADHNVAANTPYLYCTGTITLFWKNLGDY